MTNVSVSQSSPSELAMQFEALALRQRTANFEGDTSAFNKIYDKMALVISELRSRAGDERRVLIPLLKHANAWVRYKAAVHTLVVAPIEARRVLEDLASASRDEFATAHARGAVTSLNNGTFPLK